MKHARPTAGNTTVDLRARLRGHNHASICWLSLEFKRQGQEIGVVQQDILFLSSCWWLKREMTLSDQLKYLSTWGYAAKQNGTQSMPYHKGIWYPAFSLLFSSKASGHRCTHLAFHCTRSRQFCFLHSRCRLRPTRKNAQRLGDFKWLVCHQSGNKWNQRAAELKNGYTAFWRC